MKLIKLTQGKYAIVDDEDFEWLNQWKWHLGSYGYARHEVSRGRFIYMHILVNKTPKGFETDHINRNKLDNRRSNLRNADKRTNAINTGLRSTNKSGYKGVFFIERINKYEAYLHSHYKKIHLGYFDEIKDAVLARKQAEEIYHAV